MRCFPIPGSALSCRRPVNLQVEGCESHSPRQETIEEQQRRFVARNAWTAAAACRALQGCVSGNPLPEINSAAVTDTAPEADDLHGAFCIRIRDPDLPPGVRV